MSHHGTGEGTMSPNNTRMEDGVLYWPKSVTYFLNGSLCTFTYYYNNLISKNEGLNFCLH